MTCDGYGNLSFPLASIGLQLFEHLVCLALHFERLSYEDRVAYFVFGISLPLCDPI